MIVWFNNEEVEVFGRQVEVGTNIHTCALVDSEFNIVDISKIEKNKIIYSVTSISDPAYQNTLTELNNFAKILESEVIVVTTDAPFTIKEKESKYPNISFYTDYMYLNFAAKFGVLIEKYRLLVEAIFVIDSDNTILNFEYYDFEDRLSAEKLKDL